MKKILIIEDNEDNLYLIQFILEKNGYQVEFAKEGRNGITMALKGKPDLILMDVQLPDVNGLEATKIIRESEIDGSIPIVAITSYAMTGDKERALKAGCSGYIEKPIDPETFLQEIQKYI